MDEGFFRRDGDRMVPSDYCRGPWNRESLHGRAISGLLGWAIEQHVPDDSWHAVRLTVDMFRLAPHAPVEVRSSLSRDGNRVRAVDAALLIDGVEVARASGLVLRRSEQPATTSNTGPREAPRPDDLAVEPPDEAGPRGDFRDAWDTRSTSPDERPFTWLRMVPPFVTGEPTSAWVRAAATADFSNPASNRSEPRSAFINGDLTVHLQRHPTGEWIGFEPAYHESLDGIAVGSCRLHDLEGLIGLGTVSAVANDRARTRAARPSVG